MRCPLTFTGLVLVMLWILAHRSERATPYRVVGRASAGQQTLLLAVPGWRVGGGGHAVHG